MIWVNVEWWAWNESGWFEWIGRVTYVAPIGHDDDGVWTPIGDRGRGHVTRGNMDAADDVAIAAAVGALLTLSPFQKRNLFFAFFFFCFFAFFFCLFLFFCSSSEIDEAAEAAAFYYLSSAAAAAAAAALDNSSGRFQWIILSWWRTEINIDSNSFQFGSKLIKHSYHQSCRSFNELPRSSVSTFIRARLDSNHQSNSFQQNRVSCIHKVLNNRRASIDSYVCFTQLQSGMVLGSSLSRLHSIIQIRAFELIDRIELLIILAQIEPSKIIERGFADEGMLHDPKDSLGILRVRWCLRSPQLLFITFSEPVRNGTRSRRFLVALWSDPSTPQSTWSIETIERSWRGKESKTITRKNPRQTGIASMNLLR